MKKLLLFSISLAAGLCLFWTPPAFGGEIVLKWANRKPAPWMKLIREDETFSYFVEHINDSFLLPHDMFLLIDDCGEANAFYDPEGPHIIFCRELLDEFYTFSANLAEPGSDYFQELFLDSVIFTLYHEFGHAAVDIFELPITGKEEDVADQVSTWVVLNEIWEEDQDGVIAALDAADFFALSAEEEDLGVEELPFWDTHSLDMQRYYNIICWTYGYNPKLTEAAMEAKITTVLEPERVEFCEDEYAVLHNSLLELLEPHFKHEEENDLQGQGGRFFPN